MLQHFNRVTTEQHVKDFLRIPSGRAGLIRRWFGDPRPKIRKIWATERSERAIKTPFVMFGRLAGGK
jgi:hypothetical protein